MPIIQIVKTVNVNLPLRGIVMTKWYCFWRFIENHLEYVFDNKEESDKWLDFWDHDPKCFVIEVFG